jgi:hypothetical protein
LSSSRGLVHDPGMIGEAAPLADRYRFAPRTGRSKSR